MGSVFKSITGGSSQKQQSTSGGFNDLPGSIKDAFGTLGTNISSTLLNGNGTDMFTPLPQTADETAAFDVLRNNNPLDNLSANIAALMDPYQENVINRINRNSAAQFSDVNEALNANGQLGSNRSILGQSDVMAANQDQIGSFLSGQFNNSVQNALTTIPNAQANYATNLANIAGTQRQLDGATNQAQVQALLAAAQAMGVLPTSAGGSQSSGSGSSSNGIFKPISLFGS